MQNKIQNVTGCSYITERDVATAVFRFIAVSGSNFWTVTVCDDHNFLFFSRFYSALHICVKNVTIAKLSVFCSRVRRLAEGGQLRRWDLLPWGSRLKRECREKRQQPPLL